MPTPKDDDITAQMREAVDAMGIGDDETGILVRLIVQGALSVDTDVLARTAAMQAGVQLATQVLRDLHRIADAQEILARHALDQAKPLFEGK